ncbi:MAG TPA: UxaA family hydrolase [Thermoguttaceae bacterium]|nr:UxaA family hydrolase [Thermoguttaceae bacterium]
MAEFSLQGRSHPRLLQLAPEDNVAAATTTIEAGESITLDGRPVTVPVRIPTGHKVALMPIAAGEKVIKYGAPIGSATRDIRPGEYVHTHNLASDYLPTYTLDGASPYLEDD